MSHVQAIKNENGDWIIDVLGVPFGGPFDGKDHDGEYFDATTELWLDEIGSRAIVHYHGKDSDRPEIIARELSHETREDGVWFRLALDKTKEVASGLWDAAQRGLLRASSGAISHLVRKDDDGRISVWPIGEISLLNLDRGEVPANPYAVAAPALQSLFKSAKLDWPADWDEATEPDRQTAERDDSNLAPTPPKPQKDNPMSDKKEAANVVTMEDIKNLLDERDAEKERRAHIAALEAQAEELKKLKAEIEAAKEARVEAEAKAKANEQINKLPNPTQEEKPKVDVQVVGKYDGFSIGQLGLAYDMLKATGNTPSAELFRTIHAKATKAVDTGDIYANQIGRNEKGNVTHEYNPGENAKVAKAIKAINPMEWADTKATKANELLYSTQSSGGDEWVPALWSMELWDQVRNTARVLPVFRQVEVPGESLTIPAKTAGATVYKVGQSTDQVDLNIGDDVNAVMSKATTSNVTLTPTKGMAWLGFSEEFVEDSIVPVITALQDSLRMDIAEQIDEILISGDTDTGTTNISTRGATFATTSRFLMVNGLRDAAFADSNTSDRGTLAAADFTAVMALLGTNGAFALEPDRLIWILDPITYRAALALGENLTKETGVGTVTSGRIMALFGSRVIVTDQYAATDSTGYIDGVTAGNNTLGSFLLVRPDRGYVGFGRTIRIETPARDLVSIVSDTRHLVASFRMDFQKTQEVAALGFNVS